MQLLKFKETLVTNNGIIFEAPGMFGHYVVLDDGINKYSTYFPTKTGSHCLPNHDTLHATFLACEKHERSLYGI